MEENLEIEALPREVLGKKVKILRQKGFIPAIVYGHRIDPFCVSLRYNDFEKLYRKTGKSTIFVLKIPKSRSRQVLIQDVQIDPISRKSLHVDLYQVKMTEKITAEVPLEFIGTSPAVEEKDGILLKNITTLEVTCLPADLPHSLEVDISSLSNFEEAIHVKDLKIPQTIEVLTPEEEVVVTVEPPRSEEELAALEELPAEEVPAEEVPEVAEVGKEEEKIEEGKEEEKKEEGKEEEKKEETSPEK